MKRDEVWSGDGLARPRAVSNARAGLLNLPRRDLALAGLLAAVTFNHYTFAVAGLHVKLEHVSVLLLLIVAAWDWLRGNRPFAMRALLWIPVFLGITLLASALNAPDRLAGLRYTALIALVAAGAGVVYWLADTPARFHTAIRLLIGFGLLEAGIAFVALVAAQLGSAFGTQPGLIGTRVVYGTLWEPNVLGSYLAAVGVLTLAVLLPRRGRWSSAWLAGGLALILAALGLSSTRAAWLGFLAGGLLVLLGTRLTGGGVWRNAGLALLAALVALGFLVGVAPRVFPTTSLGLIARVNLSTYNPQTDDSIQVRADSTSQALAGIAAHPLLGNGAGSFGVEHVGEKGAPGWISNLELHVLYDSGVLGLAALLGGWGFLGWRAWRTLRAPSLDDLDLRPAVIGLLGASAALLVAYQATEATWLGYTWIYIGLLARAGTLHVSRPSGKSI